MIGYLQGRPQIVGEKIIIHTAGGVGYLVAVTEATLNAAATKSELALYTYTFVREDRLELYAVEQPNDLVLFEQLLTVSGVGPRVALALLGNGGANKLIEAVQQANVSFFTSVPRVGKKLAQKIVIELKTKLGGLKDLDLSPKSQNYQDVRESLMSLGYLEGEIELVLMDFEEVIDGQDIATTIKQAIKVLTVNKRVN